MKDNPLRKKLGPLEVWQYAAIGISLGGILYLYKKGSENKSNTPEEEEHLLGALRSAPGGESIPSGISNTPMTPGVGEPGPPGIPGEPGAPGAPGAVAETAGQEQVKKEMSPHVSAPPAKTASKVRHITRTNANGVVEHFTVHGSGKTARVFQTPAEKAAAARALAARKGKSQPAKARGTHKGTTGKPNHSKSTPLHHRVDTTQAKSRHAAEAKRKHEAEVRRRREREARERREHEAEARRKSVRRKAKI